MVSCTKCYKINLPAFYLQRGVVLITSLVFLIALTAIAAALMQNATTDMKMSGASEDKMIATQEAISAIDEVIYRQVNAETGNNIFALPLTNFPIIVTNTLKITNTANDTTAQITAGVHNLSLPSDCPHSSAASSVQLFTCNILRVQVNRKYGRNHANNIEVNSGIVQQVLRKN